MVIRRVSQLSLVKLKRNTQTQTYLQIHKQTKTHTLHTKIPKTMKHKLSVQKKPVMKVNGETYRSEIYNYFTKFVKSFDRIH